MVQEEMQLCHVELYSGIGGMRLGVSCILPPQVKHICKAIDVNTNANRVYLHNFGERPAAQSLEYCTAVDLVIKQQQKQQQQQQQHEPVAAVSGSRQPLLWTLSPPCQPYTTTSHSKQEDANDTRATSLAHILSLLPTLQQLPTHILLENVTSFYKSQSHKQLHNVLSTLGYQVFDVALCPSQLGIPHLRPRHYTLAKLQTNCRSSMSGSSCNNAFSQAVVQQLQLLEHGREPQHIQWSTGWWKHRQQQQHSCPIHAPADQQPERAQRQLQHYLQLDWAQYVQPLMDSSAEVQEQVARYALPLNTVARYFKLLDIVTPTMSHHSNCFTKGYGKSIMGTGSYLMEDAAAQQLACKDSRGRYHLTGDPYLQHCLVACSSHVAVRGTALEGAAAAAAGGGTVKGREAEEASCNQQQAGMPSHVKVSQFDQQEPQTKLQCFEVSTGLLQPQTSGEQHQQQHQQQQAVTQPAVSVVEPAAATVSEGQIAPLLRVRRFTPREIANLMGFPDWFEFPTEITDRQAYALLGNSLSIDAVSYLAHLLLEDVLDGSFYEACI